MMTKMKNLTRGCITNHEESYQGDCERDFIDAYLTQMKKVEGDPESSFHKVTILVFVKLYVSE